MKYKLLEGIVDDEIERVSETLKDLSPLDERYCELLDVLGKLKELRLSRSKSEEKSTKYLWVDRTIKVFELVVTGAISIGGIILPLMCYDKWFSEGLTFEEKGSFTSSTFKGFFNKMKPYR